MVDVSTGTVAQRIDYDEFGVVMMDTNPGFQPFGFAGGLYDKDTGFVRFGARDYDAQVGRWTAKDPLKFSGGDVNLYNYVANNPITLIDPTGLDSSQQEGTVVDLQPLVPVQDNRTPDPDKIGSLLLQEVCRRHKRAGAVWYTDWRLKTKI